MAAKSGVRMKCSDCSEETEGIDGRGNPVCKSCMVKRREGAGVSMMRIRVVDPDGSGTFMFQVKGNRVVKMEKCASQKTMRS